MKDHSPGSICSIQRRLGNEFCFCLNKCLHFRCCFLTAVEQDLWPSNEELMATSRLDPDCSVQLKGPPKEPQFLTYPKVRTPQCVPLTEITTHEGDGTCGVTLSKGMDLS